MARGEEEACLKCLSQELVMEYFTIFSMFKISSKRFSLHQSLEKMEVLFCQNILDDVA